MLTSVNESIISIWKILSEKFKILDAIHVVVFYGQAYAIFVSIIAYMN